MLRLEPVIMELEQHERILIVAHQGNFIISHILGLTWPCLATIRCLYAYFMNLDHDQLPYARVPLHTLIELTPTAYHCEVKYYKGNAIEITWYKDRLLKAFVVAADIEAVDTYRPKAAGVENVVHSKKSGSQTEAVGAAGEVTDPSEPILPIPHHHHNHSYRS